MMKSKVVRGIINGGVLAAVAALGITVYQLGTKPLTESKDDSVQMEETGLEEEISDEGDAEVSGSGSTDEDSVKNAAVDADGMAGSSGTGDMADRGSSAEGTGAAAANANESNSAAVAGVNGSAVNKAAGKLADGTGADSAETASAGNNSTGNTGTDSTETSAAGIAAQNLNFTENSLMEWPVRGTVLIDYNMNETVYYPTLDQYRVSSAIAVQAVEDAPVYAAADGQVLSVEQDACTGTTVTMELGNGYQAVYGQLKDLTVAEGDTVKEGEVIGNVSEPTKYYSIEGSNVYFQLKHGEQTVDPLDYLE